MGKQTFSNEMPIIVNELFWGFLNTSTQTAVFMLSLQESPNSILFAIKILPVRLILTTTLFTNKDTSHFKILRTSDGNKFVKFSIEKNL